MINENHVMPDGYDATKHVSTSDCPCAPISEGIADEIVDGVTIQTETWRHNAI